MNGWNTQNTNDSDTVTLMLAGPQNRTRVWHSAISGDERFRIVTIATTPQDLSAKLNTNPDVILLDASIYPGPQALMEGLGQVQVATYIILPPIPPAEAEKLSETLLALEPVKAVYQVDANLSVLAERMFGDARAHRRVTGASIWSSTAGGPTPVSTRIISVWNQMGGVGKTTISSNLAVEAARRGYPTLLVGLGGPDDLPLIMGLKSQPNITHWQANPSLEGLKSAIQKVNTLDVIGGYPDSLTRTQALSIAPDQPGSLKNLVDTAIHAGYAVIIFDTPQDGLTYNAITASNTRVIVGQPSASGVYRTVEAYRTVMERLSGLHNITSNNVFIVINKVYKGYRLNADRFHQYASQTLGRSFPPVITQIPDDVIVGDAQDRRVSPLEASQDFAAALKPLADALFYSPNGHRKPAGSEKVLRLGKIKIRL